MTPTSVGAGIFLCSFGGALAGMVVRRWLPTHHLAKETEDAVRIGMGIVATMTALVLGLLLASAKTSREATEQQLKLFSPISSCSTATWRTTVPRPARRATSSAATR